jgi:antirestriction protein
VSEACQIYVACLSAYNNGYLHGKWIDATQDEESILAEIHTMLAASPVVELDGEACEERAIHDYENFYGIKIDEHESIDRIVEIAQKLEEHGEAFAAYLENYSYEDIDDFEERYLGCYKSKQDYVEEYYEQSGMLKQIEAAGLKAYYIDFEAIARDMFIDGYSGIDRGHETLYVFSDY